MSLASSRLRALAVTTVTALAASLLLLPTTSTADAAAAPAPAAADTGPLGVASKDTVGGLLVENSFVSSVGWVKPGETYPSRILLTNPAPRRCRRPGRGDRPDRHDASPPPAAAPPSAATAGPSPGRPAAVARRRPAPWSSRARPPRSPSSRPSSGATSPRRATVTVGSASTDPHQPRPEGDPAGRAATTPRATATGPFPVVPVDYPDRDYQDDPRARRWTRSINDPDVRRARRSTCSRRCRWASSSPTAPCPPTASRPPDFDLRARLRLHPRRDPGGDTCTGGVTFADRPIAAVGTPALPRADHRRRLPAARQHRVLRRRRQRLRRRRRTRRRRRAAGHRLRLRSAPASWSTTRRRSPTRRSTTPTTTPTRTASSTSSWSSSPAAAATAPPSSPRRRLPLRRRAVRQRLAALARRWSSTTPTPRPACPASPPTTSSRTSRAGRSGTPTTTYTRDDDHRHGDALKVFVRVGPYNVNPETAIDKASVISHEYGHSLGLPDFYSTGGRETYGDWNLMATDKSQNMDVFCRQELGWVVPEVLEPRHRTGRPAHRLQAGHRHDHLADAGRHAVHADRGRRRHRAQLPDVRRQAARPPAARPGEVRHRRQGAARRTPGGRGSGNDFGCAPDGGPQPRPRDPASSPTCPTGTHGHAELQVAAGTSSGTTTTASC